MDLRPGTPVPRSESQSFHPQQRKSQDRTAGRDGDRGDSLALISEAEALGAFLLRSDPWVPGVGGQLRWEISDWPGGATPSAALLEGGLNAARESGGHPAEETQKAALSQRRPRGRHTHPEQTGLGADASGECGPSGPASRPLPPSPEPDPASPPRRPPFPAWRPEACFSP